MTFAQDAAAGPVTLTYLDRFCVDGKRLRLTSSENLSNYGQPGTTYQTELADFRNFTANGTAGIGPSYFTVKGPDGTQYWFGYTDPSTGYGVQSQVLASGSSTAVAWLLSKVQDTAGNTMEISYTAASGAAVPATIYWTPTSHAATSYAYTMAFTYGTNQPQSSTYKYVSGTPIVNTTLLTKVTTSYSGSVVRVLAPTYQTSSTTGRYRLSQIQECADAALTNCLAATSFTYQNGTLGISSASHTANSAAAAGVIASYDFNNSYRVSAYISWPLAAAVLVLVTVVYSIFGSGSPADHKRAGQVIGVIAWLLAGVLLDRRFRKFLHDPPMLTHEESIGEKHLVFRFRAISFGVFALTCLVGYFLHRAQVLQGF